MATPAKPATQSTAKSGAKSATKATSTIRAKPATSTSGASVHAAAEPFLRFRHSPELKARTDAVLTALEASPALDGHGDALADLVAELTEAGMNYYYLRALKDAQVGFVVEQSARLAMSGAVKLISSVSRKFIVRMDDAQLLVVARHIRHLAR
jgi:hypothetical protein